MRPSARDLTLATLQRQRLLSRVPATVTGAVRQIFAVQAQEPASPYLALWNRVRELDAADVDRAFADGDLVKATLMRITLHAVVAEDHAPLYAAMVPSLRRSRLRDKRFLALGVPEAVADEALATLLERDLRTPLTNAQIDAVLRERGHDLPAPGLWWAMRTYGPVRHAVTGGPWSFGARPAYVAADHPPDVGADAAHLVRRYLAAFGPATVADLGQFTLLISRPELRAAVTAGIDRGDVVRLDGPDGADLVDVVDGEFADPDVDVPPRLLPMWDSILLAYADRRRIIPEAYRAHVIRRNGDTLATLLVDGQVAGVWRATADGVEVGAFHRLPRRVWRAIEPEAAALRAFLADRDPEVYRRYRHWWETLPLADVRTL